MGSHRKTAVAKGSLVQWRLASPAEVCKDMKVSIAMRRREGIER